VPGDTVHQRRQDRASDLSTTVPFPMLRDRHRVPDRSSGELFRGNADDVAALIGSDIVVVSEDQDYSDPGV
jgi:hypothetical protein